MVSSAEALSCMPRRRQRDVSSLFIVFNMNNVYAFAAPSVTSPSTLGGVYAQGNCGFTNSSASSTTTHGLISYKYAKLRATYRQGNSYMPAGIDDATSTSTVSAQVTVSLPSGGNYYVGAMGEHVVQYSNLTWSDNTSIGDNYYGW